MKLFGGIIVKYSEIRYNAKTIPKERNESMDNRASVRTVGLATGTVVLLIVLFLVAGISTGFLPWRDSYLQAPEVTPIVDSLESAPTADPNAEPTPTPTPTPTPEPEDIAPGLLPDDNVILDEELPAYTIIVTFSRGGTAIPYGSSTVVEGGTITVQAVPNEGYAVDEIIVDGERYPNTNSYTFSDVDANHNVHITFKRVIFDPNEQYGEEGTPPIE